jgi:2-methylisocitrate lyase-like PEP mutase family enzyme
MSKSLQSLLAQGMVVAPGVYDGVSARLLERSPFTAAYVSGYCVAASRFGVPDAGIIGLREMSDALDTISQCITKPLIADADTGFGGLINIQQTVRTYERRGVSAIQIEDQEMPKKCGHTQGKRVVPLPEMLARVQVALESRSNTSTLIIARTDSLAVHGFDEAMERCTRFIQAGADLVFMDGIRKAEHMATFGQAFQGKAMINIVPFPDFVTPEYTISDLAQMGFGIAIFPATLLISGMCAMDESLQRLAVDLPAHVPASYSSPHRLMGFEGVWADEARWADLFSRQT